MFNGRRIDLEQLAGQARALWQAREDRVVRSHVVELFSHAAWLSLFVVLVSTANQLTQLQVRPWRALMPALLATLPSLSFPFAILAITVAILHRIRLQAGWQLPNVQLPFNAAPLMQRVSLYLTEFATRLKALGAGLSLALPLPTLHIQLDDSDVVQSVMLFAQRMSRNWLEVCAILQVLIERTYSITVTHLSLTGSALVLTGLQAHLLARVPHVTVLRC